MKQRGKQLLSVLLTLVMLLGMVPGMTLGARATDGHMHTLDGTSGDDVTYTKFSTEHENISLAGSTYTITPVNSSSLSFYLDSDLSGRIDIAGDNNTQNAVINLCLNGHKINASGTNDSAITIGNHVTLNLCDCHAHSKDATDTHNYKVVDGLGVVQDSAEGATGSFVGGYITGGNAENGGGVNVNGDAFNLYGGTIIGNQATDGGGVYSWNPVTQYGGAIIGNQATNGGGVLMGAADDPMRAFTMMDGVICDNTATNGGGVYMDAAYAAIKMQGGTIRGNKAENGGGVYVKEIGERELLGGTIAGNQATNGGGVYAENNVTISATVNENTATYGGGVFVAPNTYVKLSGKCAITGNTAATQGGGVYFEKLVSEEEEGDSALFVIRDAAKVYGNTLTDPTTKSNVYMFSGKQIWVGEFGEQGYQSFTLENGANIGLTLEDGAGVFTNRLTAAQQSAYKNESNALTGYFFSDNPSYGVLPTEEEDEADDQLKLGAVVPPHEHKLDDADESASQVNFTRFSTLTPDNNKVYTIEPGEGNTLSYYLDADVEGRIEIPANSGTVNLCLNGHKIDAAGTGNTAITVRNASTLNLCDCHAHSEAEADTHYYQINDTTHLAEIIDKTAYDALDANAAKGSFVGGYITGGGGGNGSGVFVLGEATFRMSGGTIIGNQSDTGAGIYAGRNTTFQMTGGNVIGNYTERDGGGIMVDYDNHAIISGVTVEHNYAVGSGGGILACGIDSITDSVIQNNTCASADISNEGGGGIYNDSALTLTNCTISGNKAGGYGGGIKNYGALTISGGAITNNTSQSNGGGIYHEGLNKTVTITDCTISQNSASEAGGGIYHRYDTMTINGGSITGNTAGTSGAGVFVVGNRTLKLNGAPTITGNTVGDKANNVYLEFFDPSYYAYITSDASGAGDYAGLKTGANVGVTLHEGYANNARRFTSGISKADAESYITANYFSDDAAQYSVMLFSDTDGDLKLDNAYAELTTLTLSNSTHADRNGSGGEATYPWVGDTLSALATDGENTEAKPVTYQWYRTDKDGSNAKPIGGATEKTYTATAEDVDKYLMVVATQNQGADGNALATPITKQASIGPVALRPAPTPFAEKRPTYPSSANGQITKTHAEEDISEYANLYCSTDNGKTWTKVQTDGKASATDNLPTGTYLFTYRNSGGSLPESRIATVILTAQYDLIWLKLTSETDGKKANEVGATVKAVTNLDDEENEILPGSTTLTYNWYFIDKDGYKSADPITTDSATRVIEERHAGGKLLAEAVWKDNEGKTIKSLSTPTPIILSITPAAYSVNGKVNRAANASDNTGTACASATVELRQGNTVIATATTDASGDYDFSGNEVPNGEYNIVVTKDGVTKTEHVTVSGGDAAVNVLLPFHDVSSLIVVQGNTPAVVIGSLDDLAKTESADITAGQSIEVKLTVEGKEDLTEKADSGLTTAQQAEKADQTAVKEKAKATTGAGTVVEFLDMGIVKSTTTTENTTTETIRDTGENILKIRIPYVTEGRYQFGIYRKHVDDTNVETTIAFANNNSHGDGTFEVGDGYLDVYATKFSTYAIGYTTTPPAAYSSGAAAATYPVTVSAPTNGTAKADKSSAAANAKVTVTAAPNDGYKVNTVIVTDQDGKVIPVSRNANGAYSFTMPASAVTVSVTFANAIASPKDTGVANWLITDDHIVYLRGYEDGTIRPTGSITRAEVAMMFYRLLKDKSIEAPEGYVDVSAGMWYSEAVNALSSLGILSGYGDKTFLPNNPISRAEFAAVATRFAIAAGGDASFPDIPNGYWAEANIATAAKYGWINGYEDGAYRPSGNITRAEAATIVNHMLGRAADEQYVLANRSRLVQFSDLQSTSVWYYFDMVEASTAHDFTTDGGAETWKAK